MADQEGAYGITWDNLHQLPEMQRLYQLAMRVAVGIQEKPRRCRRQSCRASGRCHMIVGLDGRGHCGARFDFDRAVRDAAAMIAFLYHFTRIHARGEPWSRHSKDSRLGDPVKRKRRKGPRPPSGRLNKGGEGGRASQDKPHGRDLEWQGQEGATGHVTRTDPAPFVPAGMADAAAPVEQASPRLRPLS